MLLARAFHFLCFLVLVLGVFRDLGELPQVRVVIANIILDSDELLIFADLVEVLDDAHRKFVVFLIERTHSR